MKSIILSLLIFSQISYADCTDVTPVTKGDTVPCDGILLSPDASKKADQAIQDSKYYHDLSDKLVEREGLTNKEMDTLDQRIKLYQTESTDLASQLNRQATDDKWEKLLYFGLGVITSGLAVYGASQLAPKSR